MRLGCEVTAVDINPVAWFILKCTLEYPQRLANQQRPLPAFACQSREFMESYFKAKGFKGATLEVQLAALGLHKKGTGQHELTGIETKVASVEADLAWHVRAWGWWVLQQARADLERFYPTVDDKPTVAYLWARTVTCKNCRATVPLLKTRWLCKKDSKRVVLTMEPNAENTGVVFGVQSNPPMLAKGNAAQKRENDKKLGGGTMSNSGVTCPCCCTIMKMEDLRLAGKSGKLGTVMTAVVVDGENQREYRLPTEDEIRLVSEAEQNVSNVFEKIPFGLPEESTPGIAGRKRSSSSLRIYGLLQWKDIFTTRQLLALGTFVNYTRASRNVMLEQGYSPEWVEAVGAYLALALDRLADYSSTICSWTSGRETIRDTFGRFALPMIWDFTEVEPCAKTSGGYPGAIEWISKFISHSLIFATESNLPHVVQNSATKSSTMLDGTFNTFDVSFVEYHGSYTTLVKS